MKFVQSYTAQQGRPPTRENVATHFGFNRATAQQHIVAIEKLGALKRSPGARGLTLTTPSALAARHVQVPVVGRVAAGVPLLAVEDPLGTIPVPEGMFRVMPQVLLRVQGDSMKDAGILDNDLVAVVATPTATHGQIVVARIDDEVTVKRLHTQRGRIVLKPANERYAPIQIKAGIDFAVEGIVVGVLRQF